MSFDFLISISFPFYFSLTNRLHSSEANTIAVKFINCSCQIVFSLFFSSSIFRSFYRSRAQLTQNSLFSLVLLLIFKAHNADWIYRFDWFCFCWIDAINFHVFRFISNSFDFIHFRLSISFYRQSNINRHIVNVMQSKMISKGFFLSLSQLTRERKKPQRNLASERNSFHYKVSFLNFKNDKENK